MFPPRSHANTVTRDDLRHAANLAIHAIEGSTPFATPPEVAKAIQDATDEEIRRGERRGPFTCEEMNRRPPRGWLPYVRFPVCHNDKVRPCDDYAKFGHNGTASAHETVDTEGPGALAAAAKLWIGSMRSDGTVPMTLEDGTISEGNLQSSLTNEDVERLVARLIDLAWAYKQLARQPCAADFAIFAHQDENRVWCCFEAVSLVFGARNAYLVSTFPLGHCCSCWTCCCGFPLPTSTTTSTR